MISAPILLWRRLLAEFLGSAFLAAVVIGSGIAAQRLSPGQTGLQLLENAAATAAGLFAIILMFGPVSGAHFNPVVSFADAVFGGLRAYLERIFDPKVFVISFVFNVFVASLIVYVGDQLGVGTQLSTAIIVVLGIRIFGNAAALRRRLFGA